MTQSLTICFITCRREPMIEWFFDSLKNQLEHAKDIVIRVAVIDFHYSEERSKSFLSKMREGMHAKHYPPKPCVWSGPHKLTKEDWFSAANARNTGLCLAPDGYIAFVDDLSVLLPNWLLNVRQSMQWNGITLGAYRKVKKLEVENGIVKSFDESWTGGKDSRWSFGSDTDSVPCNGDMMFGCSFVAPVEALLTVGGFPEICNGLGFEDVVMGQALANAGFHFRYNRNMLTYESEEHHHIEGKLRYADDWPPEKAFRRESFEKHPNDKTDKGHAVLNMVKSGVKYFENYYEGGIRKMREEVLSGKPFPILNNPQHDFHTGVALKDL